LRTVTVTFPDMWGNVKVEACRSQLQHELCEGRGSHTIEVKIGGRHE
jgi:hypothetical protein